VIQQQTLVVPVQQQLQRQQQLEALIVEQQQVPLAPQKQALLQAPAPEPVVPTEAEDRGEYSTSTRASTIIPGVGHKQMYQDDASLRTRDIIGSAGAPSINGGGG
jgi:hypothetical protein